MEMITILTKRQDLVLINKNKIICHQVDFGVPADNRVKIKETKKINKNLALLPKS